MFCESILWRMTYSQDWESGDTLSVLPDLWQHRRMPAEMLAPSSFPSQPSSTRTRAESSPEMRRRGPGGCNGQWPSRKDWHWTPVQADAAPLWRNFSSGVDIPSPVKSAGEAFLVPSSCQSICENYSDLHIGGDQVLPLSASTGDLAAGGSIDLADGPFLQSCEIPPALESSPQPSLEYPPRPLQRSSALRKSSTKERSLLLQGSQPLSNSQLNRYLEQKLLDLYQQHMVESMVRGSSPTTILASQHVLTSVDQITQQLSREQNLETAKAKDMVLSCLLRVASGLVSSEISTPQLQISADAGVM
ncbi:TLR adapter interacting with SLC15A4 on the lysosome [Brienomyrus brachyistius]|uniref:TLR adapter interacting with SLC15A4 on the lysosome n=1 Tax=Brienomyrus brachyistius TaxID=42636 RepID=UPI0020B1E059|nr:TLR adapter interacting with SLC15A4 on the lysosome [Brienomyrus brachyistius]